MKSNNSFSIETKIYSSNDNVEFQQVNFLHNKVPDELSRLFGVTNMDYQTLISNINQLSQSISNDENTIINLKIQLESQIQKTESKLLQKRYQLNVSQNLLKEIDKEIKNLEHQKKNILDGDYDGQITLNMAQTKGFLFLRRDLRHAIEYLSSEIDFPLNQINFNNKSSIYSSSETMRGEISSLFRDVVKIIKEYESQNSANVKTKSSLYEKMSYLNHCVKEKRKIRHNLKFEVNQLEFELQRRNQNKSIIKMMPEQLEDKGKGKKLINSMKKEYYRLNRILNEFDNQNQSFNFESSIFDSIVFDNETFGGPSSENDLNRLVRIISTNIRDLSNSVVENKKMLIRKKDDKSLIYKSYINSFQNIITSINHANDDFFNSFENQHE